MKRTIFWVGGLCGVVAGIVLALSKQAKPIDVLAHELQEAWANHHTVA